MAQMREDTENNALLEAKSVEFVILFSTLLALRSGFVNLVKSETPVMIIVSIRSPKETGTHCRHHADDGAVCRNQVG